MAAGPTYEAIATSTLGTATNSVVFSSIPGTYTDLILVISATRPSGFDDGSIRFNGDTANNYSTIILAADGGTVSTTRYANYNLGLNYLYNSQVTTNISYIMGYTSTWRHKTVLTKVADATTGGYRSNITLWKNTSAITTIELINSGSSNFGAGSIFSLYGIKCA
jgi:hypothetical protein